MAMIVCVMGVPDNFDSRPSLLESGFQNLAQFARNINEYKPVSRLSCQAEPLTISRCGTEKATKRVAVDRNVVDVYRNAEQRGGASLQNNSIRHRLLGATKGMAQW